MARADAGRTDALDLDGRTLADRIRARCAPEVVALLRAGRRPRLLAIQVGHDEASEAYVRGQRRGAESWGIAYETLEFEAGVREEEVRSAIRDANTDRAVHGILLQLPLPAHLPARALQHEIAPEKDVEGVHPENLGHVVFGRAGAGPCTAVAVMELLESSGAALRGAEAVVVGHSEIVGKPLALMCLARDATTTVCHKYTKDLAAHTRRADILVVAVGRPGLVTASMVKPGAVVVDVGINAVPAPGAEGAAGRTRIVGDVDAEGLRAIGCRVSPVPGGVGPVTVAVLMRNTVRAAEEARPSDEDTALPLFPLPRE